MKVMDLQCGLSHRFEGWFASEDDYQAQLAAGLVECPVCEDRRIHKMPSAPRLNLRGAALPQAAPAVLANGPQSQSEAGLQAQWFDQVRQVLAHTEDVGSRFAEEARRIHYGESRTRSIRGQASTGETLELLEEGISVLPLRLPKALKEPLQ